MAGTSFSGPLKHSPKLETTGYAYRSGTGMMSSAEFLVLHDDFNIRIASNVPLGYDAAIIDTGATIVMDTTAGSATGVLLFDSDGADEGAAFYGPKAYQLTSGKKFWMEARVKPEVADDCDFQFGLCALTATTNPEDLWTTTQTDLITFGVLDGSATVKMLADKSNSGSTVETGTISLTSDTWATLAIYYDGVRLHGYVNGQRAITWAQAAATIPTGVGLSIFAGYRNGSSANNEGRIDYVRLVVER
jgi:hypothetical protein